MVEYNRRMPSPCSVSKYVVLAIVLTVTLLLFLQQWASDDQLLQDRDGDQRKVHLLTEKRPGTECRKPEKPVYYSQSGEDVALFNRYYASPLVCNGTFVEIGGLDGRTFSNTKFLEDHLGWTGVLIEAEPSNAKRMMINRPKTKNFAMAVCPEGQKTVQFAGRGAVGGILKHMTEGHKNYFLGSNRKTIDIPCEPMSAILYKAGVHKIDLFSLDVEGSELLVLQTMDWSIPVRVFLVEMGRGENDNKLIQLLSEHGYKKADWNITDHCPKSSDYCALNTVFENTNWPP